MGQRAFAGAASDTFQTAGAKINNFAESGGGGKTGFFKATGSALGGYTNSAMAWGSSAFTKGINSVTSGGGSNIREIQSTPVGDPATHQSRATTPESLGSRSNASKIAAGESSKDMSAFALSGSEVEDRNYGVVVE
jgi:hypothetical protein